MAEEAPTHFEPFEAEGVVVRFDSQKQHGAISVVVPDGRVIEAFFQCSGARVLRITDEGPEFTDKPAQLETVEPGARVLGWFIVARKGPRAETWGLLPTEGGSIPRPAGWEGSWLDQLRYSGYLKSFIGGQVEIGPPTGPVQTSGILAEVELESSALVLWLDERRVRTGLGLVFRPSAQPLRYPVGDRARAVHSAASNGSYALEVRPVGRGGWVRIQFHSPEAEPAEKPAGRPLELVVFAPAEPLAPLAPQQPETVPPYENEPGKPDLPQLAEPEVGPSLVVEPEEADGHPSSSPAHFRPFKAEATVVKYFPEGYGFAVVSRLGADDVRVHFEAEGCREIAGSADGPVMTSKPARRTPATQGWRSKLFMVVIPGSRGPRSPAWGIVPRRDWSEELRSLRWQFADEYLDADANATSFFTQGEVTMFDWTDKMAFVNASGPDGRPIEVRIWARQCVRVAGTLDKPVLTVQRAFFRSLPLWTPVFMRVQADVRRPGQWFASAWGIMPEEARNPIQPVFGVVSEIHSRFGVALAERPDDDPLVVRFGFDRCHELDETSAPIILSDELRKVPDSLNHGSRVFLLVDTTLRRRRPRHRAVAWGVLSEVEGPPPEDLLLGSNREVDARGFIADGFVRSFDETIWCGRATVCNMDGRLVSVVFGMGECRELGGDTFHPTLTDRVVSMPPIPARGERIVMRVRGAGSDYQVLAWGVFLDI